MGKLQRHDDADAFIPEFGSSDKSRDDLAELLAEDFLNSATGGDDLEERVRDEVLEEELGGPFLTTDGATEFGSTVNDAAPTDPEAEEREALPQAVAPLIIKPRRR